MIKAYKAMHGKKNAARKNIFSQNVRAHNHLLSLNADSFKTNKASIFLNNAYLNYLIYWIYMVMTDKCCALSKKF